MDGENIYVPDKTTLVLVVDQVERVVSPNLLDLPDILLQSHL